MTDWLKHLVTWGRDILKQRQLMSNWLTLTCRAINDVTKHKFTPVHQTNRLLNHLLIPSVVVYLYSGAGVDTKSPQLRIPSQQQGFSLSCWLISITAICRCCSRQSATLVLSSAFRFFCFVFFLTLIAHGGGSPGEITRTCQSRRECPWSRSCPVDSLCPRSLGPFDKVRCPVVCFFSPPTSRLYVVFYAILVGGLSDDLMLMVCPWIPTLAPAHRKEMMRATAHARTRASSLVPARWHLRVCVCYWTISLWVISLPSKTLQICFYSI